MKVLIGVIILVVVAVITPVSHSHAIDRCNSLKQDLVQRMAPAEKYHFFGDAMEPLTFDLVRPAITSLPSPPHPPNHISLVIRSSNFHVDAVLGSAEGLVAPHVASGIIVDGETILIQPSLCHYRTSNATHIITVNNCDSHGLDGIFISPNKLATLHPLPNHLLYFVQHSLPACSHHFISDNSFSGIHILHVTLKENINSHGRRRRSSSSVDSSLDELRTCATGPEHDVRGQNLDEALQVIPHRFHSLDELTRNINIKDEPNEEDKSVGYEENDASIFVDGEDPDIHNHTVTAAPVSAVLRRTVELAVFCDESLYHNFPQRVNSDDKSRLINYILTLVNAVQGIYHQEELGGFVLDLKVVRLDILTNRGPSTGGGDIGAYLNSFCSWQEKLNPAQDSDAEHWDHAFMLSGLDLHSSGQTSVIGLAWVGGMCRPLHSCTMNEGRSFMSVYVVAHEMGHNLGMKHDGSHDASHCSHTRYIMSPSVGPGKTTWSSCSSEVLRTFLRQSTCLDDGDDTISLTNIGAVKDGAAPRNQHSSRVGRGRKQLEVENGAEVDLESILKKTPGYQFSLLDQCRAMFGRDYHPAITKFDLCDYLYCTNGVVTRPAHPALEGSFCGSHRVCIAGKCRPEENMATLLLYNLPPSDQNKTESSTSSATPVSPPTTVSPGTISSTEQLPINEMTCCLDNNSSTIVPQPAVNNSNSSPDIFANVTREICPFIAPVYHHLFHCSNQCFFYDLYLDVISGNITNVNPDKISLQNAAESCFFGSYTIIFDDGIYRSDITKDIQSPQGSGATLGDIRDLLKNSVACQGIPQFLHPTLQCPTSEAIRNEDCPPGRIILKTPGYNFTYTLTNDKTNFRSLNWKGNYYSLSRSEQTRDGKTFQTILAPVIGESKEESYSSFINCDLETTFPTELKDLPNTVCPFLAPSLHDLFNCPVHSDECPQYITVVNLDEHDVRKVPLNTSQLETLPQYSELNIQDILFEVIEVISEILLKSDFLCKLIPFSWLSFIPGCASSGSLAALSEDDCLPVFLIIHTQNTTFTYTSDLTDTHKPTIEWRGNKFALDNIDVNRTLSDILMNKFGLDFSSQVSRKQQLDELQLTSDTNGKGRTGLLKTSDHEKEKFHLNKLASGTLKTVEVNSLREYVGQNDVFLPLNAPEAMARTKVGQCSVTCGEGVREVQLECVEVKTDQLLDDDACQGFITTKIQLEPCYFPPCHQPRWSVGGWGRCSEDCGAGVQFRRVQCVMSVPQELKEETYGGNELVTDPHLVVDDGHCAEDPPIRVQGCHGDCLPDPQCEKGMGCVPYADDLQISKDFDY